jgi:hypothetical protein
MSDTNFTPGPWECSDNSEENGVDTVKGDANIAVVGLRWTAHAEELQANRRLIAAAPELLNAARRLMAGTGLEPHDCPCGCCVCEMASAIAKAVQP